MSQDLVKPKRNGEQFISPWEVWTVSFTKLFRFLFLTRSEGNNPQNEPLDTMLPVIKDDLSKFNTQPALGIRHMWIGHATSLLQFDGVTFLTDPIFSDYCSPLRMLGPRRYRPPPCTVQDLPHIDFVLISHNHYDHLDYSTVVQLNDRFGDNLTWYVPLGLKQWMNDSGCNNVIEMNWWEEHTISAKDVRVICTPCQHWCRRGIWDTNKVLWCSWCVVGPKSKFYFAGDTGYCDVFKTIGKHYGPFDLATIPIGAYNPSDSEVDFPNLNKDNLTDEEFMDSDLDEDLSESDEAESFTPSAEEWRPVDDHDCGPRPVLFTAHPGPKHALAPDAKPVDYVNLFLTDDIVNLVVNETNKYARQFIKDNHKNLETTPRSRVQSPNMRCSWAFYLIPCSLSHLKMP
uniref:Metallo-beta-lactamase domain-containing protein n=1 Tax=Biomphalaria glabrata TaxID=6526 RepID=A0A2C9JCT7_BIOGL